MLTEKEPHAIIKLLNVGTVSYRRTSLHQIEYQEVVFMFEGKLCFEKSKTGQQYPAFYKNQGGESLVKCFEIKEPARVCALMPGDPYFELCGDYDSVIQQGDIFVATARLSDKCGTSFIIVDKWSVVNQTTVGLDRTVTMEEQGDTQGFRSVLYLKSTFEEGVDVRDFEYLAPSTFYRHLDTDGDGVPDNYQTYNISWSEDKLSFPAVMAYHTKKGFYASLYRLDCADHDESILEHVWNGERFFNLDTDLGSLGIQYCDGEETNQVMLRAYYPLYEGQVSYALDRKGYPWGAFKQAGKNQTLSCSYRIHFDEAVNFADACWKLNKHVMHVYNPEHVELKYSFDEVNKYRVEFLNKFFYEFPEEEDPLRPAGYIVNQHPLEGRTLGHVYEYGFSGKQLMNAYVSIRYSYEHDIPEYREKALEAIRFFNESVVQENGFVHGVYSADEHCFVPWYSGILLPYSFATKREEQERYLGKETVEGLSTIHNELKKTKGAFTRPMSEEGFSLLTCYELEKEHGHDNPEWVDVAKRIGDFFLRIQNSDGSWYRSVDPDGKPVRVPEAWFGRSEDMRKSTTYNIVTFMVKLYEVTKEQAYLDAAIKGGDFTIFKYVRTSYMYGTLLDHPFNGPMRATGPILDNVSPMFAMEALLALYEVTKEERFKNGAIDAAKISATWVNLWDVPFPDGTTLANYNFRSTGWSPVNVYGGSFQTDLYPLYFTCDFVKVAELTGDMDYLKIAELLQYAMNDMVSTPKETYGYAHYGLQNEGRVMTWFFVKEWAKPVEGKAGSFEFAGRGKGEENKTAYGWMYAIPLGSHYRMVDTYGSLDFNAIREKLQG